MKVIKCELCGSNEFKKVGDEYECQYCHTKYGVEEAKKMMIEGTVDVSGSTVKIDNTSTIEQYLANARRARDKEDWEEVEKYYNLVEKSDATNIEAIFYSAYAKYRVTILEDYTPKWTAAYNVLQKCISVLDDNFDIENESSQRKVIIDAFNDVMLLSGTGGGVICGKSASEYVSGRKMVSNWSINLYPTMIETADNIIEKYKEKNLDYTYLEELKNKMNATKPQPGCYVATCVYGSYDCPEVWTLRRFRDNYLDKRILGRAFIKMYYFISPKVVRIFGNNKYFKKINKLILDKWVVKLNSNGYENTRYNDKY